MVLKEKANMGQGVRYFFYLPDNVVPVISSLFADIKLIPIEQPAFEDKEVLVENTLKTHIM